MPRKKPKRKPGARRAGPPANRPAAPPLGPPRPVELLNEIPVEPELMAEALANMADASHPDGRMTFGEMTVSAVSTYAEFYGHDDENPVPPSRSMRWWPSPVASSR